MTTKGHNDAKDLRGQEKSGQKTMKKTLKIAIDGPSGAGKTTFCNLIPRFYDVSSGAIRVDGRDIRDYKVRSLRTKIGMMQQDVYLFSDTVAGNIEYGRPGATREEIIEAAKLAGADEFINDLSDGYDTIVGERGVGLSGGQKQRISLARALAIRPSILILDDTTSAVDLETEAKIQEGLRTIRFDCTKLIIAQRISSTRDADLIIVMKDGKIEEMGTSDELLANKGYFYDVYKLQYGDPEEIKKGVIG